MTSAQLFAVAAKSESKRARFLAASGFRTQPFFLSACHRKVESYQSRRRRRNNGGFSHGRYGHGARYSGTIITVHHVSSMITIFVTRYNKKAAHSSTTQSPEFAASFPTHILNSSNAGVLHTAINFIVAWLAARLVSRGRVCCVVSKTYRIAHTRAWPGK